MSFRIEKDWTTRAGLRAVVILVTDMGHRCGYVGVPAGHPLHSVSYHDKTECLTFPSQEPIGKRGVLAILCSDGEPTPEVVFDVHGSLTYSGDGDYPIKSEGLWWFGFDCGHAGDGRDTAFMPGYLRGFLGNADPIRSTEYCVDECEALAQQIIDRVQVTP